MQIVKFILKCSNENKSALGHMETQIWVSIGSGIDLVPVCTKPLPAPILTSHSEWTSYDSV